MQLNPQSMIQTAFDERCMIMKKSQVARGWRLEISQT